MDSESQAILLGETKSPRVSAGFLTKSLKDSESQKIESQKKSGIENDSVRITSFSAIIFFSFLAYGSGFIPFLFYLSHNGVIGATIANVIIHYLIGIFSGYTDILRNWINQSSKFASSQRIDHIDFRLASCFIILVFLCLASFGLTLSSCLVTGNYELGTIEIIFVIYNILIYSFLIIGGLGYGIIYFFSYNGFRETSSDKNPWEFLTRSHKDNWIIPTRKSIYCFLPIISYATGFIFFGLKTPSSISVMCYLTATILYILGFSILSVMINDPTDHPYRRAHIEWRQNVSSCLIFFFTAFFIIVEIINVVFISSDLTVGSSNILIGSLIYCTFPIVIGSIIGIIYFFKYFCSYSG